MLRALFRSFYPGPASAVQPRSREQNSSWSPGCWAASLAECPQQSLPARGPGLLGAFRLRALLLHNPRPPCPADRHDHRSTCSRVSVPELPPRGGRQPVAAGHRGPQGARLLPGGSCCAQLGLCRLFFSFLCGCWLLVMCPLVLGAGYWGVGKARLWLGWWRARLCPRSLLALCCLGARVKEASCFCLLQRLVHGDGEKGVRGGVRVRG